MRDIITKLEELNVEKEQLNEGLADMAHEAEKDHEVQMARSDCYKSAKYAVAIHKMLKDVSEMEGIDGWVAAKITKAADYLGSVKHYMEGQAMSDVELAVVPVAGDMTDAMTVPQESVEEGFKIRDKSRGYGVSDKTYATRAEAEEARLLKMAATGGDWEIIEEAEERDYICVHAKKGKYECSGTSSYAAAKKAAEHWGLKSTAGIDAHLADKEHTATESIEEVELDEDVSAMANSRDVVERTYGQIMQGSRGSQPDQSEVGDYIPKGMTPEQIMELIDMLEPQGYDKDFLLKDLADMMQEDEDIIGDIISKLPQTKAGSKGSKDVIGDIIAKLPKDSDEKTVNMPSLPKSKPERTPTVSAVAQQAAANKAVRSMAQDTTRPLRQSKFSEWSKK